ncbi:hypothetical protein BT96DRAFT_1010888 [Gymnopus androsaceus JB14]|uniref:Uncharacterized protein n=1 Tax=Gymnopus androsaceus JB14 TaxID=1447944 RepID=A0A6A4GA31_9AGAR|nr:hypothetical protein BT96DRAFT_1010888 [Gymnopus androsaceus JB14]
MSNIDIKWVGHRDDWLNSGSCQGCKTMYNPRKDRQILCRNCNQWWCFEHPEQLEDTQEWEETKEDDETDVYKALGTYATLEQSADQRMLPGRSGTSTPEAMTNFKAGPIIRGLGWVYDLYPEHVAPADLGWLMTGNEKVSKVGGEIYPGAVYKKMSWTYDVDSKGTPDSVAKAMYQAVTGVLDYLICPDCKANM